MCSTKWHSKKQHFWQSHHFVEQRAICTLTYEAPDTQTMKVCVVRRVIGRVTTCSDELCRRYQLVNFDEKLNFKNNDGGDVWEKRPRGSEYQRMAHSQVTLVYIAPVPARGTA